MKGNFIASWVFSGYHKGEECDIRIRMRSMLSRVGVASIVLVMSFLFCFHPVPIQAHGNDNYVKSDIHSSMKKGDKLAVLMVYFGTTYAETRKQTIERLFNLVKKQFPGVEVREAFSSRIIIKRLSDRGIFMLNPAQALEKLHKDGFTHILIQEANVIDGVEVESLQEDIANVRHLFKDVRIGDPLLYSPADYKRVINIITRGADPNTAYVVVGHGTYNPTTAQYAMLDYMLKAEGHKNFLVGTVEGYPTFDDMCRELKQTGLKKVELVPLMFVAGDHAHKDIARKWFGKLEKQGYTVSMRMKGLGQYPDILQMYIENLLFVSTHRKMDILEKKAIYSRTGKRME